MKLFKYNFIYWNKINIITLHFFILPSIFKISVDFIINLATFDAKNAM